MTPLPSPLSLLFIFALVHLIQAQCVTSGYVLCLPAGSELGGIPQDDFVNPDLWDSLQDVAIAAIGTNAIRRDLVSRQDALCCAPTDDCLVVTDSNTPFCFDTDTTRYVFSDDSFGYVSNGTYYAADGTFVDYAKGYYSSTDGSTGTFAPATAAATSSGAAAMSSGAGAGATSSKAAKATSTAAKGIESHTSATTSLVKGTHQTVAPTPTTTKTTTGSRSDSTTLMPSSSIGWLGLYLACLTVFLV